jgi:phosphate-selective porin OprO/OprP
VTYGVGVFNGVPDGANGIEDENEDKDVEGRLFLHPFAGLKLDPLRGLGVGFAGSFGEQEGALPNYRTPGRQTFFAYVESDTVTAVADGRQVRFSPQGYYYYGPVGVLAEYVQRIQEVSDGTTTTELSASAWQAAASFVVGGTAGYRGAKVKTALDPRAGGWGAIEVALRYGELSLDRDAFDAGLADLTTAVNGASNFGVAASWWWFDGTRALIAYDFTQFDGGSADGDRDAEHLLIARLQVAL